MDKISVIVPIYNVAQYIELCLDSILNQTYEKLEILLIDDGSTDESGSICDIYALQDNRIRVFHKSNGGVSSARNLGLERCTGDWVSFVDPDDFLEPDMYEVLIYSAIKYNVDISVCGYMPTYLREASNCENGIVHNFKVLNYSSSMSSLLDCNSNYFCGVWNKLIKRECINSNRFNINIKNGEDLLFLYNIFKNYRGKTAFCCEKKYYYFIRTDSASNISYFNKNMISELKVWSFIYNDLDYSEEYYEAKLLADYMCKMCVVRLMLKAALLNNTYGYEIYNMIKKENKKYLNFSKLKSINDYIKIGIIKLFPYNNIGMIWSKVLYIKFKLR